MTNFNPRPYERGDDDCCEVDPSYEAFQSTPLREGRLAVSETVAGIRNFNPRPYERGDLLPCGCNIRPGNFNPRPYERGDSEPLSLRSLVRDFNPRPYERGDYANIYTALILGISIHAPTRGATRSHPGEAYP